MASKGWLTRFDDPIVLDDGTTLTTLRDAIHYLAKTVPKAERDHKKVLTASDHLVRSAEQGSGVLRPRGDLAGDLPQQGARVQSRTEGVSLGQAEAEARPMTVGGNDVRVAASADIPNGEYEVRKVPKPDMALTIQLPSRRPNPSKMA
jgi:hypothetical protein